jgi:hypothetical protein
MIATNNEYSYYLLLCKSNDTRRPEEILLRAGRFRWTQQLISSWPMFDGVVAEGAKGAARFRSDERKEPAATPQRIETIRTDRYVGVLS